MYLIRKSDASLVENETEIRRYYLPDRDPLEVIETWMSPNASQEAHSHQVVREAMLVLEGKVFVEEVEEIVSDQFNRQTLNSGDFVVFDRGIFHRIANNSCVRARILHFKFLGERKDRTLFVEDKNDASYWQKLTASEFEIYTQDYRHFDSMMWQVPAWASAIFSFSITIAFLLLANSAEIENLLPSINAKISVSIFLFSEFVILLLLLNVFLRFRLHQRLVIRPKRRNVPRLWYMLPGQSSLLLILFIELAVILCFFLITVEVELMYAIGVTVLFFVSGFGYVEMSVRQFSSFLRASRENSPRG